MNKNSTYSRDFPFYAAIKERFALCMQQMGGKTTYHVILDISDSSIEYEVGDSLAILPKNSLALVSEILEILQIDPEVMVTSRSNQVLSFKNFLFNAANLSSIPKKLVQAAAMRQTNSSKKEQLQNLLTAGNEALFKEYAFTLELIDFLKEHHEVAFLPEELALWLQPLMPRFYSIASSYKKNSDEIHLTVALYEYECASSLRKGVCSSFLWHETALNEKVIPIYIQPHKGFTLPSDAASPIIMVGPGTGVAPFRGFMEERALTEGAGDSWLFFGERHGKYHNYYEDYWFELKQSNRLRVDYAFSRDQEHKIYVQHRLLENGKEIFEWLEKGAYFFVCGDAHTMAKDVEKALHTIVAEHGKLSETETKAYIKNLRLTKRYCRDVY